jgi:hypothetical protein
MQKPEPKISMNQGAAYWSRITGAPRPHRGTLPSRIFCDTYRSRQPMPLIVPPARHGQHKCSGRSMISTV